MANHPIIKVRPFFFFVDHLMNAQLSLIYKCQIKYDINIVITAIISVCGEKERARKEVKC